MNCIRSIGLSFWLLLLAAIPALGDVSQRVVADRLEVFTSWQATGLSSFSQVTVESWKQSGLTLRASGSAVNASSVTTTLDGNTLGNVFSNGRWYADTNLSTGSHTLTATASYNVGQYSAGASSTFTVIGTNGVTDYYDLAGNVTNRVFTSGKTQALTWDGFGRLVGVTQRESTNTGSGFNWTAIYDAGGRRLRTVMTPVVSNVVNSTMTLTLDSYYDPQVEFEEVAVGINGQRTWKVLGPDLGGVYGRMHGVGGLEATFRENGSQTNGVLNDCFGNVLATVSGTTVNWSPVRVGGYGPVLGYEAPTLTLSTPLAETELWRSRNIDPSGFYYLGARYYDPMAGRFLSADPYGHAASMDLYSAFFGDPVNCFDPDGRYGAAAGKAVIEFDQRVFAFDAKAIDFGVNLMVGTFGTPNPEGATDGQRYALAQMAISTYGSPMQRYFHAYDGTPPLVRDLPAQLGPTTQDAMMAYYAGRETANPVRNQPPPSETQWGARVDDPYIRWQNDTRSGTIQQNQPLVLTDMDSFSSRLLTENLLAKIPGGMPEGAKILDAGTSWYVIEYPNGVQTIRFDAKMATQPVGMPATKGGVSGTFETGASVSPSGRVYVSEGLHRLNAVAIDGASVAESVPGAPGWLEYDFMGYTETEGGPLGWGKPLNKTPQVNLEGYDY